MKHPQKSDAEIRAILDIERKENNRKSAKLSREKRKKQEQYLDVIIPAGQDWKQRLVRKVNKSKVCRYSFYYNPFYQHHAVIRVALIRISNYCSCSKYIKVCLGSK